MLSNYYKMGKQTVSGKQVDDNINQIQEKLIKFFGEKYRNQITQKIGKTKYVFVQKCSLDYEEDIVSRYKDPLKSYVEARFGSFEKLNNTYKQGGTVTKDNFLSILQNAKNSLKVDDNTLNILLAFNSRFDEETPTKEEMQASANRIISGVQNYHFTYDFDIILNDYKAYFEVLKYKFDVYKQTQRSLNLTEREEVVCDCLEQFFGDNINSNVKIASEYLTYKELADKKGITDEQKHAFEKMFNELTGQTLHYTDYIKDKSFLNKLSQVDSLIQQKLVEKNLSQDEAGNQLRISLPMLKNLTSNYTNGNGVYESICNFAKNKIDWNGFQTRLFHDTGVCDSCIVLMNEGDSHIISHETIHAISCQDNGSGMGFRTDDSNFALNEVITEMFNMMANGCNLSTWEGTPLNYYSAAMPTLKKFVDKHLKQFQEFYLCSDIQGLQKFLGPENYTALCKNITAILKLAVEKGYEAPQIETFIKNPASCEDKKIMNLLNESRDIIRQINSHIRKEKMSKLFGL